MKITRLKLKNFIGIMHGLNTDEIEIDFSKCKNTIIALLGGNGSGKSTIMSQLQPYKESFDSRKSLIIDGKDGLKEIDFEHDGHKYEIVHKYDKLAKSYFKKDGVELNPEGTVGHCEELIEKELGVTKDYFKVSKLGGNTRCFVDLTSAERKKYICTLLNSDVINEKAEIANTRLRELKRDMDSVTSELKKYHERNIIETEIKSIEETRDQITQELSDLYIKQGSVSTVVSNAKNRLSEYKSLDALVAAQEEKTKIKEETAVISANLKKELKITGTTDTDTIISDLSKEISQLQTEIQVNKSEVDNKSLLFTDTKNKISSTEISISALGNPEDINRLDETINELTKQSGEIQQSVKANPVSHLVAKMIKEKQSVDKMLNRFTDFTDFIEKYFNDLSAKTFNNVTSNIELFFQNDFEASLKRQIAEAAKVVDEKEKLLDSQKNTRSIKETHICQLKNLEMRPKTCTDNECPFIKEAYSHRNVLSEIEVCEKEIAQSKKDLEILKTKSENLQLVQNLYLEFISNRDSLLVRENQIYQEFVKEKNLIDWVLGSLADFQKARQELIDNISNADNDLTTYKTLYQQLQHAKESKKALEDSDSTIRSKYEDDLKELKQSLDSYDKDIKDLKEAGTALSAKLLTRQELLAKYNSYKDAESKHASSATSESTLKADITKVIQFSKELSDGEIELVNISNRINELTNLKNEKDGIILGLKTNLNNLINLTNKLENIKKEYTPIDKISTALGPKGIQQVLANVYLAGTEQIANRLLESAFNGEFHIKFQNTEKEFAIQVISKDNIKPDIKLASQGEIAITTISISLALIEQSAGDRYNILYLDEIDGPLDAGNRLNFVNILKSQIDEMGLEQVFVISHNDAFDIAPMDMVLLKGNKVNKDNASFMENKEIIYENEGE